MSQIVKLRRSSVSGQKPTNSNLQLGELALNTTDGKVYMAKSGSLGPSVEELITTNTVNTGSLSITGAITGSIFTGSFKGDGGELYNIPASGVTGLQLNKIVDGAFSASISSTRGFEVNTSSSFNGRMLVRTSGSINSLNVIGNHESYTQLEVINTNSGSSASGDIVVTSNSGNESVHYVNMGINSSTYNAGYVGRANDSYLINSGEDLYIGTIGGGTHSSDLHLFTQDNWENPQIHISGSKQIGFNTSSVSNGFQYEFSGSIKGKNNLTVVGSVSSSMFTGSFKGDGSELYNIPLSGVTNLTTISGSIDNRLDILEAYSGSQLVPSSSMSLRTLETSVYCKNITGTQINKGTVVRIVGSVGDNPLIGVANLMTEGQSANTLGFAKENIPNDSFGLVVTEGIFYGVNTSGMTAGDLLYLGTGGTFTTTPPVAPNHGVRLGEVLRVQQINGSIYVRVDNGIELNEAHDVIYTGITHGDLLVRSGSLWKNSKSLEGNYVVTGSLTVTQNLTVLGSSSLVYVTSSNLSVSASFISVNVFEPAERFGGLKVYDSGSSNATASLAWDSQHNHWVYQNVSGSQYSGGMLLSGPRNTGSLGDEPTLISGRIAKSVGGDHIDNSIISETGTTINIDGNLVVNSITGSFDFSGLTNKPTLVSGSSQIDITATTGYSTFSSSVKDRIDNVTGSVTDLSSSVKDRIDTVTSSIIYLSSSVKDRIDTVTSSIIYLSSSVKDRIDTVTSSVIYLSSSVKDRIDTVTGSITYLSSSVKDRIDLTTSSITFLSSSVKDRIDVVTGSITDLSSSINITTNNLDGRLDSIESFTSSVVLTSQTSSMTVLSSSYALTASYALNGGSGGGEGQTAKLLQTTPSTTWTFVHNLGEQYPAITIFDSNDNVVIPTSINAQNDNTLIITFSSPQSGIASATVGGGLPFISGSYQGRVLAADNNAPVWKSGILSGSLQIFNLGYATTGSNVLKGNQNISGSIAIGNSAEIGSKCVTISSTTQLFDLAIFNGANFDYVVKDGLNMRAGVIMGAWNGTNGVYNESSTMDLGNTSGVTFNVTSTGKLNAVITNGSWTIQVLYRALGCGLTFPAIVPPN